MIFGERNFIFGTFFIICTPQNRSFRGPGCLVLRVVLVARNCPAECYNWHPIYNCELCITLHRGPQQGFVTEGLRQRFVTGGARDKPPVRATPIYLCMSVLAYVLRMYVLAYTHV